jgi:hypothetical protein
MNFKKNLPYVIAILVFVIASLLYFSPVLKGQKLNQSDITQFRGMSKEIVDYRAEKGEEPYWTGAAFSGMPAYQVSAYYPNDYIKKVDQILRFLPRPADYLFLYFVGFFLLLIALKTDWKLAVLGALSFGFSTYLIIIFGAGHNAKAHAIAYMPMVLAGVLWVFQKRYLLGFIVTALAMGLEINTNHPQMTYYLLFIILIFGIVWLIDAIQKKQLQDFFKSVAIVTVAVVLAVGINATRLLSMKEYADHSTRGKTALTINADGTLKKVTDGLSKEYITEYSYGIAETFNLLIPRFMGGGTVEDLDENSNFYEAIQTKYGVQAANEYSKQVLTYWGDQTIVEAPAYIGAVVFFLFFLGVFLVKGKLRNWLLAATVFSIVLSWGKNLDLITNFFIDYVPLYNKFRAVSSIQVIAELCVPLLGILALKEFFSSEVSSEEKQKALKKALYVLGGITLFFMLFGSSLFAFDGFRDGTLSQFKIDGLVDALIADRKALMFQDSLRSFVLISISFGLLWLFLKNKLNQTKTIVVVAALILFDLVSVDLNYVNAQDFKRARSIEKPFTLNDADRQILEDTGHYRVGNFAGNVMQDGRTSYFHQSIGGYHAAKMGRYQELFDYQIAKNNMGALNMLNTKYFIVGANQVQVNPDANGNAWFVHEVIKVNSADEEMKALDNLKTKQAAVIDVSYLKSTISFPKEIDTTASIQLTKYDVTTLEYSSNSTIAQFAVFSEIYYKEGWNAFIDGKSNPHYRVNYVLRGMLIPAGEHTVVFKFEPTVIKSGTTITSISYLLLLFIPIAWFFIARRKN